MFIEHYYYKNDSQTTLSDKYQYNSKELNIKVNCQETSEKRRTPAFLAAKITNQPLTANEASKITYENENFDIGDIYNATTSTFVPRESGIYYVAASFTFASEENVPYRTRADIVVNGITVQADNDYWDNLDILNALTVSAVLQLQAGDLVEIFGQSTVTGIIEEGVQVSTFSSSNFEAFKV